MSFTYNGIAVQGVTYNGVEVKSITYNGVEVWRGVWMDWTSDPPPKMKGNITDGVYKGSLISWNGGDKVNALWDKPFVINFDYKYISGGASDWANIFAFGTHTNHYSRDKFVYTISLTGRSQRDMIYSFDANNHDFHNWQIKYNGTSLIYLLDGKQVATVNPTDKPKAFYFSGGGFCSVLDCEIKNFCIYRSV